MIMLESQIFSTPNFGTMPITKCNLLSRKIMFFLYARQYIFQSEETVRVDRV